VEFRPALAALAFALGTGTASAGAPPSRAEAGVDLLSRYVWRGATLSPRGAVQTWAEAGTGPWTASAWGNASATEGRNARYDETELRLAAVGSLAGWDWTPSVAYRGYPGREDSRDTWEASLRLERPWAALTLFTEQTFDVRRYPGLYYGDVGAGWKRSFGGRTAAGVEVSGGWASAEYGDFYFGRRSAGGTYAAVEAWWERRTAGGLSVRPHAGWSRLLESAARRADGRPQRPEWGLALGAEF
jgi:hypothetical protein